MLDELSAIQSIHQSQKKWRRSLQIAFILIILPCSILFVVFPTNVSGVVMQMAMVLSMGAVFGFFFLDRISYLLNKKYFKQDVLHKNIFQNLKPEDVHKDENLVVELVHKRRKNNKKMRTV